MEPTSPVSGVPRKISLTIPHNAAPSFNSRRGAALFSSAKNTRSRKGPLISFRSGRRTAARPSRTKGIFNTLLASLTEGISILKEVAEVKRAELPTEDTLRSARQNFYMELEKQVISLERRIRSLEVHKDKVEELRDEYMLKLKLRDGAFTLAQALSNRPSKAMKEKLSEARTEQRDLSEDLCDIEEELETKLGTFKVHIKSFTALHRSINNGEMIEVQVKLASQKWKARCKIARHQQQIWQDNDIFLLGKISDEMYLKVVEVKRIHGNSHIGTMKCLTREFFSFYPQTVQFTLPNEHNIKLQMEIRWNPILGEDFLSELDLKRLYCYVGSPPTSKTSSLPHSLSSVSKSQTEVVSSEKRRGKTSSAKRKDKDSEKEGHGHTSSSDIIVKEKKLSIDSSSCNRTSTPDILVGQGRPQSSYEPVDNHMLHIHSRHQRSSSAGSHTNTTISSTSLSQAGVSQGSIDDISINSTGSDRIRTPHNLSLSSLLESVLCAIEEPRDQFEELKLLESQLFRLEAALKGGRLVKAPSVTLSESHALDSFDFLDSTITGDDDTRHSLIIEGNRSGSLGDFVSLQPDTPIHKACSLDVDRASSGIGDDGYHDTPIVRETTGSVTIDRVLLQHLLHCEYLLQHLQSVSPLNQRLNSSLKKLYREAETIKELLNMAADISNMPKIEQLLPELAANDHLMKFWKAASLIDDPMCVSCELFAITLDEKYGQTMWNEFPDIANKVFSNLLSRMLGLENDECDPVESKMCVTVFQYSSFFLSSHSNKAIPKSLKEIAQELKITEGLRDGDIETKKRIANLLPTYPFNHGALLTTAHLLADKDTSLQSAAVSYLNNFAGNSPWRNKVVQCYIEYLEHSDQVVRIGACIALAQLKASSAVPQLKHLAKVDFTPVKIVATTALAELGELVSTKGVSDHPRQTTPPTNPTTHNVPQYCDTLTKV